MIDWERPEGGDRGQMILVAGVILAVLFVALALLVNAAIYTDNVATRGGDSAGEALEYQAGVVDSVGGLIDAENADGGHSSVGSIEDAVENGVGAVDATMTETHLRRGGAATIDTDTVSSDTTRGLLIRQTDSGSFDDWAVADATNARAFGISFKPSQMPALNVSEDDPFEIDLGGKQLYVYLDSETAEDELVVAETPGDPICTADSADPVRFDISGEQFGGEPCRFGWPDVDGVAFSNGVNAYGTYDLTVASPGTDPADLPEGVEAMEALYSVNALDIRIDTPELSYERAVRIAPGEPDV